MKSLKTLLPITFAALVLAAGCVTKESESTETVGETAVTSTTTVSAETSTAAESPSEQIAEGAEQIGEGLGEAGRGVAQATGKALQRAGEELEEAGQPKPDASRTGPTPDTPVAGSAAAGGRVYAAKNCGACHGANGAGGTAIAQSRNIPPLGSPSVKGQSDAELTRVLTEGKSPASAGPHKSKGLTPDEVRDVIAWIRSL